MKSELKVYPFEGNIVVCQRCDACLCGNHSHWFYETVQKPIWIEKLFGVTWESKVQKAKLEAKKCIEAETEAEIICLLTGKNK